jgi:membrane protease YdiL (CAAX protease family)
MLKFLALALFVAAPFFLLRVHRQPGAVAAILALWLPLEFGLLQSMGVSSASAVAAGMLAGILAFRSRPDILDVASAFNLRKMDFRHAFLNFAMFAVAGIPLGLFIGFIEPSIRKPDLSSIPALVATIFLFNALPEEIFFRGILQHVAESILKSRTGALMLAALIFGLAHLNNGPNVPNTRYFVMATLAGVFYGASWQRQRNVLTSAITHALVNIGWRLFFR